MSDKKNKSEARKPKKDSKYFLTFLDSVHFCGKKYKKGDMISVTEETRIRYENEQEMFKFSKG